MELSSDFEESSSKDEKVTHREVWKAAIRGECRRLGDRYFSQSWGNVAVFAKYRSLGLLFTECHRLPQIGTKGHNLAEPPELATNCPNWHRIDRIFGRIWQDWQIGTDATIMPAI
jgi:hypothetical protein